MKMRAPEGVESAAVESDQYAVDEHGEIEVVNGEHIPQLEQHGFVQVPGEVEDSAPEDELGDCPDFSKFVNRQALVDWLKAHQFEGEADSNDKRADLEALCVAQFERVRAGEARRVHPEGDEQPEQEPDADHDADADADADAEQPEGEEDADADAEQPEGEEDADADAEADEEQPEADAEEQQ